MSEIALEALLVPRSWSMALEGYGVARVSVRRTPAQMRRAIEDYERMLSTFPQVDLPVRHFFVEGRPARHIYAREMTIPAGVTLVGRVHKYATLSILSKGRLLIASETGRHEARAPRTWISPAGAQRAGFAFEESVITTLHLTDELDEKKIEDDLCTVSHEEYEAFLREMGHAPPALDSR